MENGSNRRVVLLGDFGYYLEQNGVHTEHGRGGSGTVFGGFLLRNDTPIPIAIKAFPYYANDLQTRLEYQQHVSILHDISQPHCHPCVIKFEGARCPLPCLDPESSSGVLSLLGARSIQERPVIFYELMTSDLKSHVLRQPSCVVGRSSQLLVLLSVAQGLDYLHNRKGIVHLNVSPENILLRLDKNGQITAVKLGGFGAARYSSTATSDEAIDDTSLDVWAFGGLIQYVTRGETAASRLNDFQIWQAAENKSLSLMYAEWADGIPDATLRDICKGCTHEDPASRPTMRSIVRKLANLMGVTDMAATEG